MNAVATLPGTPPIVRTQRVKSGVVQEAERSGHSG